MLAFGSAPVHTGFDSIFKALLFSADFGDHHHHHFGDHKRDAMRAACGASATVTMRRYI